MISVDQQFQKGIDFNINNRLGVYQDIAPEMLEKLTQNISKQYKNTPISVENISEVMREVFQQLDQNYTHFTFQKRMLIGREVIMRVMAENGVANPQSLILFVDYSLESIAEETLSKPEASKTYEADLEIPSSEMSSALLQAAAANIEAIEKQVDEAARYVRRTTLDVDKKIVKAQDSIRDRIDQALGRIDEARESLRDLLEDVKEWSDEVTDASVTSVEQFAEKLIETIRPPSPLVDWPIDAVTT